MIHVYGRFDGYWSHSQVSRGLVRGLYDHGIFMDIENLSGERAEDIDIVPHRPLEAPQSEVGLYIGGYPPFAIPWMSRHKRKVGLFIAESSYVPPEWAAAVEDYELLLFPSNWTRCAYIDAGVDPDRAFVVQHGLDPAFMEPAQRYKQHPLKFLHVAGAASFLDRKGTPQLLEAFKRAFKPGQAMLTLRTPLTPELQMMLAKMPTEGFVIVHRPEDSWGTLRPAAMRQLIAQSDAVVQPSRAEAFGMVPLEARAMGVPVIMTSCSGHQEHFYRSIDFEVQSGQDNAITVNGIPNGKAPSVSSNAIVRALLKFAAADHGSLPRVGMSYYERWSWRSVTEKLAQLLKQKGLNNASNR